MGHPGARSYVRGFTFPSLKRINNQVSLFNAEQMICQADGAFSDHSPWKQIVEQCVAFSVVRNPLGGVNVARDGRCDEKLTIRLKSKLSVSRGNLPTDEKHEFQAKPKERHRVWI
jgi:hypothetical protein